MKIFQFLTPWCVSFEHSAGAVVFRRDETFQGGLAIVVLDYVGGHRDFPKGHLEEGETTYDAARRETTEETGITDLSFLKDFSRDISYWYIARDNEFERRKEKGECCIIRKRVTFHIAKTSQKDIVVASPKEHRGVLWISFEEAIETLTHENAKNVLKSAYKKIHSAGGI